MVVVTRSRRWASEACVAEVLCPSVRRSKQDKEEQRELGGRVSTVVQIRLAPGRMVGGNRVVRLTVCHLCS